MLHTALLAILVNALPAAPLHPPPPPQRSFIVRCLATMNGSTYNGDPSDRVTMKAAVALCTRGVEEAQAIRVTARQGPGKLFLLARLLDRRATLSYMGLGESRSALADVRTANRYFRVIAGLKNQSADVQLAVLANVELTTLQLRTLRSDIASAPVAAAATVAVRNKRRSGAFP